MRLVRAMKNIWDCDSLLPRRSSLIAVTQLKFSLSCSLCIACIDSGLWSRVGGAGYMICSTYHGSQYPSIMERDSLFCLLLLLAGDY